ncbi:alpha/beta fold hydrolase [Streptomyces gobiensis]|uniref:alpha/beta fold hydrolase n=1 Tax=Streptomyces gobiensis TaxID=2875706 RepID=UPI001E4D1DE4|nr:alpha/beta fold hydrolase [Streptomyces gobiensis]UGY93495.1 alpha/beta hydrolase [Streptomyces gobiensis]
MSKPPTLALPRGARAYRMPTARGEFAVHEAGEPQRGTALLLPGFTGSKEDFIALLSPLAQAGFRVVAVDGRGQYESGGPPDEGAYAQAELAKDVLAQATALGGAVHVLGHSLGGLIARAAVLRDATPFRSLTLLSSGPGAVSPSQQERVKLLLGALPVMDMAAVWQAMRDLDPPEAADETTPPEVRGFLRQRWLANVPAQLTAAGHQLISEPDRVAELAAVALPKHVISGEVDYAWPVTLMDDMAERLHAHRTVIAGGAHSPNVERPFETAAALASFWASCPE